MFSHLNKSFELFAQVQPVAAAVEDDLIIESVKDKFIRRDSRLAVCGPRLRSSSDKAIRRADIGGITFLS